MPVSDKGKSKPIYVTAAKGKGLYTKFEFPEVDFFDDEIVIKAADGAIAREVKYNEILECKLQPVKEAVKVGAIFARINITFKQGASEDEENLTVYNLPAKEQNNNRDLYTWLTAKLNNEVDSSIKMEPTSTLDGEIDHGLQKAEPSAAFEKPTYSVYRGSYSMLALFAIFVLPGIIVWVYVIGYLVTAPPASYILVGFEVSGFVFTILITHLYLKRMKIQFYNDAVRVSGYFGKPKELPYSQLELGEPRISKYGVGYRIKLSVRGEGRHSWNVVGGVRMVHDPSFGDTDLYQWLRSKIAQQGEIN